MKMRLDSDAIICKGNNWYDGEISGFAFRIKEKIKRSIDVTHTKGHLSVKEWFKKYDIENSDDKTARLYMKGLKIFAQTDTRFKVSSQVGTGVEKLFIYDGKEDYDPTKLFVNFLCAQCIWTCNQGKNVQIYSCKAFESKKPK